MYAFSCWSHDSASRRAASDVIGLKYSGWAATCRSCTVGLSETSASRSSRVAARIVGFIGRPAQARSPSSARRAMLTPQSHAIHTIGPSTPPFAALAVVGEDGVQLGQQAHRRGAYRNLLASATDEERH